MNLTAALYAASSGLDSVSKRLAVVSQNVANASTPGYVREQADVSAATAYGQGSGVTTGTVVRTDNPMLQAANLTQAGTVAGLTARNTALAALDQAAGSLGSGTDLASRVGTLRDAFSTLQSDPSSQVQQTQVVSAAQDLASGLNSLGAAYTAQRQGAQDGLVSDVAAANAALTQVGQLNRQITSLRATGQSTADLENQRDAQLGQLAQFVDLQVLPQDNGSVVLATRTGMALPTDSKTGPFAIQQATIGADSAYPGSVPALTLGGADVTSQLTGGKMGAELQLRDKQIPALQAGLDSFTQQLAGRFADQGLSLFTDAQGAALTSTTGAAVSVQVNPQVVGQPSLVRDGTGAIAGSATGASAFTPNPTGGAVGFDTLIKRVLNQTFGTEAQTGVAQTAMATSGLGVNGTINLPYTAPSTLSAMASMVGQVQAQQVSDTASKLSTESAVQSTYQSKLSSSTGVTVDVELSDMVQLQASYQANAKVLTAVQTMWDQLMNMVK